MGMEENPAAILLMGPKRQVLLASDGAGVLFGVARADLVGRPLAALIVTPFGRENIWDSDGCGGGSIRNLEIRHSQGEMIPVEAQCFSFRTPPIPDVEEVGDGPSEAAVVQEDTHWMVILTDTRLIS